MQRKAYVILGWFKDNNVYVNALKFQLISFDTYCTFMNTAIHCDYSVVLGIEFDHLFTFNNPIVERFKSQPVS